MRSPLRIDRCRPPDHRPRRRWASIPLPSRNLFAARRFVPSFLPLLAIVGTILSSAWGFSSQVHAQQERAEPDGAPAVAGDSTAAPALSVADAITKARALFDRVDNSEGEVGWSDVEPDIQACISAIQAQDRNNPWLFYLWGRGFALGGRRGDAIEQLQRFVETREGRNEWRSYQLLGDLFVEEFPRLAQSNYEKAAALKDNEPGIFFGLSRCAAKVGKSEDAARLAERAVEADGRQSVRFLAHLARLQLRDRKYEDAERTARAAVSIARHRARNDRTSSRYALVLDAQLQFLSELILAKLTEPASASVVAEDTSRWIEVARERADLAQTLSRHEVLRLVESSVTRTAAAAPIKLLELYGAALADVGRLEDASEVYRRILQAEPNNPIATEQLSKLQSAGAQAGDNPPPAAP